MTAKRHFIPHSVDPQGPWTDTQPAPAEPCTHYGMDHAPELRIFAGLAAWCIGILFGLALLVVVLIAAVRP